MPELNGFALLLQAQNLGVAGLKVRSLLQLRRGLARDVGFALAQAGRTFFVCAHRLGPPVLIRPGSLEPLAFALELPAPALELASLLIQLRCAPIEPYLGYAAVAAAEEPRSVLAGDLGDSWQDRGRVGDTGLVAIDGAERYAEALCECALREPGFAPCARDPTAELEVVIGSSDRRLPRKDLLQLSEAASR